MLLTREPGGSPGAETLRGLLLSGHHDWSADAETLLHFAARADHVAHTIRPSLAAGMVVVCDRFYDSTMAYQGYGQGADVTRVAALIGLLGIVPDLTLVLDVSEAVAAERMAQRGRTLDRYDRLGPGFHARVAVGFRRIAAEATQRCTLIDADGNGDAVFGTLTQAVSHSLWERAGVRVQPSSPGFSPSARPSPNPLPEGQGLHGGSGGP